MSSIRYGPLALVGAVGLLMGLQSLIPLFTTPIEFGVWCVLALALWAPSLVRFAPDRPLVAGLFVGLVAGATTGATQAIFQSRYLAVWPDAAAQMAGVPTILIAGWFLAFALVAGAATGLVAGLVAWGSRVWKARRSAAAA